MYANQHLHRHQPLEQGSRPKTPTHGGKSRQPRSPAVGVVSQQQQQLPYHHQIHHHPPSLDLLPKPHPPSNSLASSQGLLDLIEQRQFAAIIARIQANPTEASLPLASPTTSGIHSIMNTTGNLVLHEVCKQQPTMEIITVLLDAYPVAISTKGEWGFLPLHVACASKADPEVVAHLIVAFPNATRTKDEHQGRLPLHLAAQWGADETLLQCLLQVHPKAAFCRDVSGQVPVEVAHQVNAAIWTGGEEHKRRFIETLEKTAPLLCKVFKVAREKLAGDTDVRCRELTETYQDKMYRLKETYEDDKANAVALEATLRKQVWQAKEDAAVLQEQVQQLSIQLEAKDQAVQDTKSLLRSIQSLISERMHFPPSQYLISPRIGEGHAKIHGNSPKYGTKKDHLSEEREGPPSLPDDGMVRSVPSQSRSEYKEQQRQEHRDRHNNNHRQRIEKPMEQNVHRHREEQRQPQQQLKHRRKPMHEEQAPKRSHSRDRDTEQMEAAEDEHRQPHYGDLRIDRGAVPDGRQEEREDIIDRPPMPSGTAMQSPRSHAISTVKQWISEEASEYTDEQRDMYYVEEDDTKQLLDRYQTRKDSRGSHNSNPLYSYSTDSSRDNVAHDERQYLSQQRDGGNDDAEYDNSLLRRSKSSTKRRPKTASQPGRQSPVAFVDPSPPSRQQRPPGRASSKKQYPPPHETASNASSTNSSWMNHGPNDGTGYPPSPSSGARPHSSSTRRMTSIGTDPTRPRDNTTYGMSKKKRNNMKPKSRYGNDQDELTLDSTLGDWE